MFGCASFQQMPVLTGGSILLATYRSQVWQISHTLRELQVSSPDNVEWEEYKLGYAGFGLALPANWETIEFSRETLDKNFGILGEHNSSFRRLLKIEDFRAMIVAGVQFYAVDLSGLEAGYSFPPSVNVMKIDTGVRMPLATIMKENLREIRLMADKEYPIDSELVRIGNSEAIFIRYIFTYDQGNQQLQVTQMEHYILVNETVLYVLTIAMQLDLAEQHSAIAKKIGESFHLIAMNE